MLSWRLVTAWSTLLSLVRLSQQKHFLVETYDDDANKIVNNHHAKHYDDEAYNEGT